MRAWIVLAALACAPAAQAEITDLSFSGRGKLTFVEQGDHVLFPYDPPPIGTRVQVSGTIHFGDAGSPFALPDGFTGDVEITLTDLLAGTRSFQWFVSGGESDGSPGDAVGTSMGTISLVAGRIRDFRLYLDYDSDDARLEDGGWASYNRYGDVFYGGNWTREGSVPEPSSWAMMLVGFGTAGAALRWQTKQRLRSRIPCT